MRFIKTQAICKQLLPDAVFKLAYNYALRLYQKWDSYSEDRFYFQATARAIGKCDYNTFSKIRVINTARKHSMVGRPGLFATYELAQRYKYSGGAFVECGIARGGCSLIMAEVAAGTKNLVWLFDSFEGLPDPTAEDGRDGSVIEKPKDRAAAVLTPGYCLGTLDEVGKLLRGYNVRFIKGWFEDTLPKHRGLVGNISLLRLDADWYASTKVCLDNLYDNVVPGGCIIIDDYGTLPGCRKAVDEFFKGRNIKPAFISIDISGVYYIKEIV